VRIAHGPTNSQPKITYKEREGKVRREDRTGKERKGKVAKVAGE